MNNDDLVTVVSQLYQAITGGKPEEVRGRVRNGVEAALTIKEEDPDLFYGLVTVGLAEAKNRLNLSKEANEYADKLIAHYARKSTYMQAQND
jgi:hypothetical protein